MNLKSLIFFFIVLCLAISCSKTSETPVPERVLASFRNDKLYESELSVSIPKGLSAEDSAKIATEYIDNWVTERVFFYEAKSILTDTSVIAKKISNYRKQLYFHYYREDYIYSNVNMSVTEKEIKDYYDKHLNEYILTTAYVKAHYITIPTDIVSYYPILEKVRKSDFDDEDNLINFCSGTDIRNVYFVKEWMEITDFLNMIHSKSTFPPSEMMYHTEFDYVHDSLRYLVKIDDFVSAGDLIPLEVAKPKIIEIIINKRKRDKYLQVKKDLIQKSVESGLLKMEKEK